MSGVSRRQLLGGVALVGAVGALGAYHFGPARKKPQVVIYDSRRPASLAFAHGQSGVRMVDLAGEQADNWRGVRAIRRQGPVEGLTTWNDYVAARGWLEERGLRIASEQRDRKHDLIAWMMA